MGVRKRKKQNKNKKYRYERRRLPPFTDRILKIGRTMKFILLPLLPLMLVFYSNYHGSSTQEAAVGTGPLPFHLEIKIDNKYNHDFTDFTQGYEFSDGLLYESTGLNGQSKVKILDPETMKVKQRWDIPGEYFGEGCTIYGDQLYVLTWKKRKVFVFDLASEGEFKPAQTLDLPKPGKGSPKEGWGLTHDNEHLIMSDGSNYLYYLDPVTLKVAKKLRVFQKKHATEIPVKKLNELEYIGDYIWANVWYESRIVIIDPNTGEVKHEIEFKQYWPDMGMLDYRQKSGAVLNGIAYHSSTDTVYLTGKNWPTIFEIDNPFGIGRAHAMMATMKDQEN